MGDQPPYGQPPYGQPMQPQSAGAKWGPTSMGMESHIAAGLSYFFSPILPLVFFLIEKTNRFVRFHAAQSMILGVVAIVWYVIVFIIQAVISGAANVASNGTSSGFGLTCLVGCLGWIGGLAFFAAFIWGLISGFTGKYTKLPIIGDFAERLAGGPAQPAF